MSTMVGKTMARGRETQVYSTFSFYMCRAIQPAGKPGQGASGRFTGLVRSATREICRSQKSYLSSVCLSFIIWKVGRLFLPCRCVVKITDYM